MAACPQDYVSLGGRMTTNTVEGFHGLALMYRDKRTDLEHTHYVCKTNMAVCHKVLLKYSNNTLHYYVHQLQNLGPIWKLLCLANMGVDVPSSAALNILAEQEEWEKSRKRRSTASYLHKR